MASAVGASIYVSLVFAVFLGLDGSDDLQEVVSRDRALAVAGLAFTVLASPYLVSPARGRLGAAATELPLQFTVRAFSLAALVPDFGVSLTHGD